MTDIVFSALEEAEQAVRIPKTLQKLAVPIDDLVHYERNPRRGNVNMIVQSLAQNGQYKPVVVRKGTNEILAGNHTVMAARELKWEKIAATFVDVDDDQAARIVLVDNRSNDVAGYDDGELVGLLQSLVHDDGDLLGTGYDQSDLEALAAGLNPEETEGETRQLEEDAWPTLTLRMPKELKDRLVEAMESYGGDNRAENIDALLNDHPSH